MSTNVNIGSTATNNWQRSLLITSAIACLGLVLLRALYNISFREPFLLLTSGLEEEALFSIWKFIHNERVYSDPFSIPFSGSYFNWLFYVTYGSLTSLVLKAAQLSEEWITTITHLISLAFAFLCVPLTVLICKELGLNKRRGFQWIAWAIGILLAFNPLVGWWSLTARPDMAALFFELISLLFGLRFLKRNDYYSFGAFILSAYITWSFRQIAVNVVSGVCLYLLLSRRWIFLAATVAITVSLYALTFVLSGHDYWTNTITCNAAAGLLVSHGAGNLRDAVLKAPVILGGVAGLAVYLFSSRWRDASPAINALAAICVFSLIWACLTGSKVGASQNYYMAAVAFNLLFAVAYFASNGVMVETHQHGGMLLAVLLVAQIAACSAVLIGIKGRIDIRNDQVQALVLKQKMAGVETPVLVTERYLNLPWINPTRPHFVFAYVYRAGPLKEYAYQKGGIEGLIRQQYFRMVIRPKYIDNREWPDLAGQYKFQSEDEWFLYYVSSD